MVRRPLNTLVEQGIYPSPSTSPFLHEQKQKLVRAKMGDMLKAKIASRPARQELVHRHILEDTPPGVDPSLCDKQRQLKRAKLADSLSNQLAQRPGPLELIQKNILHTEEPEVEQAVKEGQIHFRPTSSVQDDDVVYLDEDSAGSPRGAVAGPSGASLLPKSGSSDSVMSSPAMVSPQMVAAPGSTPERRSSDVGLFAVPSPPQATPSAAAKSGSTGVLSQKAYSQRCAPGKDQTSRKTKKGLKSASAAASGGGSAKQRKFKFHDYKGPQRQSRQHSSSSSSSAADNAKTAEETRYELLLTQQQLLLQWQLEHQHQVLNS